MEQQDAAHFAHSVWIGLHRMVRAHHQLGFRLGNVGALICHNAVVAGLDRTVAFDRDDRMSGDFRRDGDRRKCFKAGLSGVIDHTLPNPDEPGSVRMASGLPPTASPKDVTISAGRVTRRPKS